VRSKVKMKVVRVLEEVIRDSAIETKCTMYKIKVPRYLLTQMI